MNTLYTKTYTVFYVISQWKNRQVGGFNKCIHIYVLSIHIDHFIIHLPHFLYISKF